MHVSSGCIVRIAPSVGRQSPHPLVHIYSMGGLIPGAPRVYAYQIERRWRGGILVCHYFGVVGQYDMGKCMAPILLETPCVVLSVCWVFLYLIDC